MTKPIVDILTNEEIATIGENYLNLPEIVPSRNQIQFFRQIVRFSLSQYAAIHNYPVLDFVDYQPYVDADTMRYDLKKTGYLMISTQYNEPSAIMSKETNLLFRAAHDLHHCSTQSCNFELWGEICAFSKFAFSALECADNAKLDAKFYVSVLACEILGQLCAARLIGKFPEQKLNHCVPSGIIERILHAYRNWE